MWLIDFNAAKTQLISLDHSDNIGSIDVKIDGKSSFKIPGGLAIQNHLEAIYY